MTDQASTTPAVLEFARRLLELSLSVSETQAIIDEVLESGLACEVHEELAREIERRALRGDMNASLQ